MGQKRRKIKKERNKNISRRERNHLKKKKEIGRKKTEKK